ncbi:unnamed protein product [Paramecium pentaurelia]|uniref:Transmembrane protein n=1 Tax=Paramecium pentaurelia TaxID=43138 RepID=A0A8S1XSP2_9CILI|nr:unnamed protein product [Paramecium pentaurelia]
MSYISLTIYLKMWLFIRVIFCSLTTYYIYPDENIYSKNYGYAIDINKDNFDEQSIEKQNIELLREIKIENEQSIELNGDERLFSFILEDYIDVIILKNKSIECLYQINNYLYNNDEIIIEKKECLLLLNQSYCYQLHYLDKFIYIIQCKYDENTTIFQIVNQSQILDEIMIPIQPFCKQDSIFNKETLIFYNKQCQSTQFYSIQIYNLSFQNTQLYDLTETKELTENRAQLLDIQFITQSNLYIIYSNQIISFFLETKVIYILYSHFDVEIKQFKFLNYQTLNYVVKVNKETQQLYLNDYKFDLSIQDFQNIFIIKRNVILFHFTNKLFIKVNSFSSNEISININNLIQIGELPYFMVLSNQQLKLIKLSLPKSIVTYNNSDLIYFIQAALKNGSKFLINLKLFDPNNPIQHFQETKLFYETNNPNDQICISNQIYKRTLPIKIMQIMENQKQLQILENPKAQFLSYLDWTLTIGNIIFLQRLKDEQILIGLKQEDKFIKLIFFSNGRPIKKHQLKLLDNFIEIFFIRQPMHLVIIYQNQIEIYKLGFDKVEKTIRYIDVMIIKAIQIKYFVHYLLEDCNMMSIQLFGDYFIIGKNYYKYDCKTSLQFYKNDIYIDNHSLNFKHRQQVTQIITLKEKISEIKNVLSDYLLLFTSLDNNYYIKLYLVLKEELLFLYTLPTYNYIIQFPFHYKIQNSTLMIRAKGSIQGSFILIYDLTQTAVESLIQITEIDSEERVLFDFINDEEYIYQYQGQLQIQNIHQPCFNLKIFHESHSFVQNKAIVIKTQSLISNQNIDLDFHLFKINKNYKLELLNQNEIILTDNTINFKNIFGNIEDIQIIGQENNQVYQSLIFTNNSISCIFYRFGICINQTQILRNIFDLNTSTPIDYQDMVFSLFYIGYNPDNCNHAIYMQQKDFIFVNEFNFCYNNTKLKKNYKILAEYNYLHIEIKDMIQINDLQIFRYSSDYLLFSFQFYYLQDSKLTKSFKNQVFQCIDVAKIDNFTYLFLNIHFNYFEIRIINITKVDENPTYDILHYEQQKWNDLLSNLQTQFSQNAPGKMQIYQVNQINNQTEIKFIVINKFNLAFLIKLTVDLNDLNNINFEQQGIIRFEQEALFSSLLFIDNNYAILSFQCDEHKFINIFDISNLSEHKNIDSIQKFTNNNYTAIERYNETHFVIVENILSKYLQIHLIIIDKVRVECQGQCTKPAYLKLSNKVSEILIQIKFKYGQEINSYIQLVIIISTLISIVIKLVTKKVKNINRKQNQI